MDIRLIGMLLGMLSMLFWIMEGNTKGALWVTIDVVITIAGAYFFYSYTGVMGGATALGMSNIWSIYTLAAIPNKEEKKRRYR